MDCSINDRIPLWQTVDLADNTKKVKSVDYLTDFQDITGKMTSNLLKYLQGMHFLVYQAIIYAEKTKKAC